jgi:hypothetical protein
MTLHPLPLIKQIFFFFFINQQNPNSKKKEKKKYTRMNHFLRLTLLFLYFFLCKSQLPIPAKIDGFVYRKPTVWGESVVVEAFLDPVCPDSRDSWLPLKQALDYYSSRLSLVVHPFPLP